MQMVADWAVKMDKADRKVGRELRKPQRMQDVAIFETRPKAGAETEFRNR
jgi:hypothetical protein